MHRDILRTDLWNQAVKIKNKFKIKFKIKHRSTIMISYLLFLLKRFGEVSIENEKETKKTCKNHMMRFLACFGCLIMLIFISYYFMLTLFSAKFDRKY